MLQFNQVIHEDFAPGNLRLKLLAEPDPERVAYLEEFTRTVFRYTLSFLDAHLKESKLLKKKMWSLVSTIQSMSRKKTALHS